MLTGLIDLLREALKKQHLGRHGRFYLCSSLTHVTQIGTEGYRWSCGYRNLQMLLSSLMHISCYRGVLFNGTGEIPSVHGLQSWIEKAWRDGFDPDGAAQLGGSLLGTEKWIGATECATLLRYFGIRAQVVDFGLDENGKMITCQHPNMRIINRPSDAICDVCNVYIKKVGGRSYCCQTCDYDLCKSCHEKRLNIAVVRDSSNNSILPFVRSKRGECVSDDEFEDVVGIDDPVACKGDSEFTHRQESMLKAEREKKKQARFISKSTRHVTDQLVPWLNEYFRLKWPTEESYLPPLYLQHDGHSRTIVGILVSHLSFIF